MTDQCAQLQDDEFAALESIYPEHISLVPSPSHKPGRIYDLSIPIALPAPVSAAIAPASYSARHDYAVHPAASSSGASLPSLQLTHLPPLTCRLVFPPLYPLTEAPRVSVRANLPHGTKCSWLNAKAVRSLETRLSSMWEEEREALGGEGAGVVWRWWEWVGTGEFLSELGMMHDGRLSLTVPPALLPSSLYAALRSHEAQQLHGEFEKTAFSCSICLENRKGKSCVQMPDCACVFCNPCLGACWSLAIQEGALENVACPSVECVKRRATGDAKEEALDAELVESVVGPDLRARWLDLKETRLAEIDPTYTTCPRPSCQAPVPPPALPLSPSTPSTPPQPSSTVRTLRLPSSSTSSSPTHVLSIPNHSIEDPWARLRTCPKCHYSFCLYCSATWHGPHTPCAFPQTSALVAQYLSYEPGSAERLQMEARRGRANMERMVAKWREDEENRKWIEGRTRACAGCGVRVEKSHGCNHMTCGRCKAHFCYRCGAAISPAEPYAHFRRPGTACFERLFDQEEIDRFERETAGDAGQGGDDGGYGPVGFRGVWEW